MSRLPLLPNPQSASAGVASDVDCFETGATRCCVAHGKHVVLRELVILVVAMCDEHAVSRSQNGAGRYHHHHPAVQQQQQSHEDGPLAALARCGALAAAGNGSTMHAGRSMQRPPPPPARAAPGRPTAPPPPPPAMPPNGIGSAASVWHATWRASESVTGRACVLSLCRVYC